MHPKAAKDLKDQAKFLEKHFRDVQDIEFVEETTSGNLFILQTKPARRTPLASMRIAVHMVEEGSLNEREALERIDPLKCIPYFTSEQLTRATSPRATFVSSLASSAEEATKTHFFARGLPASQGVAKGRLAFTSADVDEILQSSNHVVYCFDDSNFMNLQAVKSSIGVCVIGGSLVSDVATLCRASTKPCVTAMRSVRVEVANWDEQGSPSKYKLVTDEGTALFAGAMVTLDGTHGNLHLGHLATESTYEDPDFQVVLNWSEKYRKLQVFAFVEAHHLADAAYAASMHPVGMIVSTDHMFQSTEERHEMTRSYFFDSSQRNVHLAKMKEHHQADFVGLFKHAAGKPVMIQLLNLSPHIFLPDDIKEACSVAVSMDRAVGDIRRKMASMCECNPAMGVRGVRLTATFPEVTNIQVEAIVNAAIDVNNEGVQVKPTILVPMVTSDRELVAAIDLINDIGLKV